MSDLPERLRKFQAEEPGFPPIFSQAADAIEAYRKTTGAQREEIESLCSQLVRANACLRQIIKADDEFRMGLPDDWEGDPLSDAVMAAKVLLSDDLVG